MTQLDLPPFIPGLELSRRFYREAVHPLLAERCPGLAHTAGLIGFGSDVIGCDTPMSRDHMWGPRLVLLLAEADFAEKRSAVDSALRRGLPHTFLGYPVDFGRPDGSGVRIMAPGQSGEVEHLVEISTIPAYFDRELGADRWQNPSQADWLTFSEQRLLSLTSGGVWQDDLGLAQIRSRLAYYPHQVWLYLLACQWSQIGQEEPFVGRTGQTGDDLGSRLITARLVQSAMRLAFLLEKRYAPYSKWFGTHFQRLAIAPQLGPHLAVALAAEDWHSREAGLGAAYELLAGQHNALGLTEPVETKCSRFHGRPFWVIHADEIASRLQAAIQDESIRKWGLWGSVNQFSLSTDLLEDVDGLGRLRGLYGSD
jgi:hypothetical protein